MIKRLIIVLKTDGVSTGCRSTGMQGGKHEASHERGTWRGVKEEEEDYATVLREEKASPLLLLLLLPPHSLSHNTSLGHKATVTHSLPAARALSP